MNIIGHFEISLSTKSINIEYRPSYWRWRQGTNISLTRSFLFFRDGWYFYVLFLIYEIYSCDLSSFNLANKSCELTSLFRPVWMNKFRNCLISLTFLKCCLRKNYTNTMTVSNVHTILIFYNILQGFIKNYFYSFLFIYYLNCGQRQ